MPINKYKSKPDKPVRLIVVNCDSANLGKVEHSINILKHCQDLADVMLIDEAFNMKVADILPDFHVSQFGATGSSKATSAVAVRKSRGRIVKARCVFGAPAVPGTGVRERYWLPTLIQIDDMKPRPFAAGHAEPKRAWSMWDRYMRRAPRGTLGLDTNKLKRAIVARFPLRQVRQVGLLAAIIPRLIPASKAHAIEVYGDHKAVLVTLWK